jgi:hypothetical protein
MVPIVQWCGLNTGRAPTWTGLEHTNSYSAPVMVMMGTPHLRNGGYPSKLKGAHRPLTGYVYG